MFKILEHNNCAHNLHKVREELNLLNFQVKAQGQLERSTALKQIMFNLSNDTGITSHIHNA